MIIETSFLKLRLITFFVMIFITKKVKKLRKNVRSSVASDKNGIYTRYSSTYSRVLVARSLVRRLSVVVSIFSSHCRDDVKKDHIVWVHEGSIMFLEKNWCRKAVNKWTFKFSLEDIIFLISTIRNIDNLTCIRDFWNTILFRRTYQKEFVERPSDIMVIHIILHRRF